MTEKILIAFDESENAGKAVDFVARTFTKDHQVTLFSVVPDTAAVCNLNSPSLIPYFRTQQMSFCEMEEKRKTAIGDNIGQARRKLLDAGFPEANVTVKIESQKRGIARDIITESQDGYKMIVMGRRGLSGIQEFLIGSISQKVLHGAKDKTVIIVE